jgi:regulator of RNase E activity RraA
MSVIVQRRPTDTLSPDEIARWYEMPAAIVVDVSDATCQIDPAIRPLCPPGRQPRLFGRAVTARCEPPDFGAVLYALDLLQPGDVLVIAAGGHTATAMIGEILGGQVRRRGGRGILCDGAVRDVAQLAAWANLSVFAWAITPRGPTSMERGAVNVAVTVGGRLVNPGDLIIGDDDGLAALDPLAARALIVAAEAKRAREAIWIASLAEGRSAVETFGLPPAGDAP